MTLAYDPTQDSAPADQCLDDVMFAMGARVPFAKGVEIYSQGEVADLIYRVVRGCVRLTHFARGRHHPIGVLSSPGDLFGLDAGPEHLMTAEAVTDCVILVASRRGLALVRGEAEVNDLIELEPAGDDGEHRPN